MLTFVEAISLAGDRAKQIVPSGQVEAMKSSDVTTTNIVASVRDMRPAGSSRIDVRGLRASNDASTSRLKPMAALRAKTMQATM